MNKVRDSIINDTQRIRNNIKFVSMCFQLKNDSIQLNTVTPDHIKNIPQADMSAHKNLSLQYQYVKFSSGFFADIFTHTINNA
jgi:hypothetical protein